MSINPSLSDRTKRLLQQLEPDGRIQLIRRCPSIRTIEKTVPFEICSLKLLGYGVEIDNVMYEISSQQLPYEGPYSRPPLDYIVDPPKLILFKISRSARNHKLETIEKYSQKMTHEEAVVCLFNKIFGGRSVPIYVNNFIYGLRWKMYDPFPFAVSFKISKLRIWENEQFVWENLSALRRIIHESSFPLKFLGCAAYKPNEIPRLLEETVKDVKVLEMRTHLRDLRPVLTSMSHSVVYFDTNMDNEMLKMLIEHWTTTNRPIGSDYTFKYGNRQELQNKMEEIREHFNGATLDEKTVILPMNEVAQIKVSYGEHPVLRVLVEAVGTIHNPIKKPPIHIDRPMSYDSMKHLLQHFEPSLRIQLARRCPSLKIIEKQLPLKINDLNLLRNGVNINGKSYEISTRQESRFPANVDCWACAKGSAVQQDLILLKIIYYIEGHKFEKIQRYEKRNKTLEEAVTLLLNIFFAGRTCPIYANNFINGFGWGHFDLLPFDVKFHIQNYKGTNFEDLRRIIHDSSFPLKFVEYSPSNLSGTFTPIVKEAGLLKVHVDRNLLRDFITNLTNPLVHFETSLTDGDLKVLIEHWTTTNRPIGNKYIFTFNRKPTLQNKMEEIREHFNGKTVDEETMILPMNETAQIKICYGEYPDYAPEEVWALAILVEAVGE
ncbi:hypothetical protein CAEBREN_24298 [Caenorhabditis brenneri]|uniref:Uncharacterized protein n=1 Tax=Caenorhabditis brenneri TaxID=135651 RepID=G0MMH1_CAEBE|nr:hypothetical protein CAEBREN_24298 [Caenorhabditis brenneri]